MPEPNDKDSNPTSNEERLRDELLDSMLTEATGADEVPDLSDRIALALAEPSRVVDTPSAYTAEALETKLGSSPRSISQTAHFLVLASAAGFLVAFLSLFSVRGSNHAVTVRVEAVRGEADYIADKQTRHFTAGDKADVLLAIGDRFSTLPGGSQTGRSQKGSSRTASGAILHLHPLGTLILSDHSTIEILSMNWTKKDSSLTLASLTVGAIVGGFTWNSLTAVRVEAGESLELTAKNSIEQADPLIQDLRNKIALLETQNTRLATDLDRKKVDEPAPVAERPEPLAAEPVPIKVMFEDPDLADTLAKVDWHTLGTNLNEMLPLIEQLAEAIANGDDMPVALVGQIQKYNGDVLMIAKGILDAEVPGTGLFGAFSHPSVVSNQLGAVLQAAGLDLDPAQRDSMERIRSIYAARDRSLRRVEEGRDLQLANLLEEADFKDEFYNQARSILTQEQRDAIWNDMSRGRTQLDPFDTSALLGSYAKRMWVKNPADVATRWSKQISSELNLEPSAQQTLDQILSRYAAGFPQSFWDVKTTRLDSKKMMSSSRIRETMRRQVAMMREVMNSVPMTAENRAGLKRAMFILVPYLR